MIQPDVDLIREARKIQTGANVHTIATRIAYYLNEIEIYNSMIEKGEDEINSYGLSKVAYTLDNIQKYENQLRKLVYKRF